MEVLWERLRVKFQSSLQDFSSLEFLPRTASWAKFSKVQPSLRDLFCNQQVLMNTRYPRLLYHAGTLVQVTYRNVTVSAVTLVPRFGETLQEPIPVG
jgi:hypothetical protein